MKRLRGDILIEGIIWLVVAGIAAGVVWKAWNGFKESIATPYVQAQKESDQKFVDRANAERDAAKKQAVDSQADIAACVVSLNAQTDQVKKWQADAAQRLADSQKAKAAALIANASKNEAIAQFQKLAHQPPVKDMTCQQQLDKLTAGLRDSARARLAPAPQ